MRTPKLCRNADGRAYANVPGSKGRQREYFGRYGSAEAELAYRDWLRRMLEAAEIGAVLTPEGWRGLSVAVLVDQFLEHAAAYYSPGELSNITCAVQPLVKLFAGCPVSEFGPRSLTKLQQHLIAKRYARGTINARMHKIKHVFRWGVSQELVPPSVMLGLSAVEGLRKGRSAAKETSPVKPAPWPHVEGLLPFLSPTVAAMVQVQLLCGMRPGEVCVMRPADVDRTGDVWIFRPAAHKNAWRGQQCMKAIPRVAQDILRPFLLRADDAYCFDPRESDAWYRSQRATGERKTKIYPCELRRREEKRKAAARKRSEQPARYDRVTYYRAVSYGFARAEKKGVSVPRWHPHQLRHSIATRIDVVLGRQAAQRWLGHARIDTTGIYVEQQVAELVTLARQLDGILNPDSPPAAEGQRSVG